jgi:hypothetical protein
MAFATWKLEVSSAKAHVQYEPAVEHDNTVLAMQTQLLSSLFSLHDIPQLVQVWSAGGEAWHTVQQSSLADAQAWA